MDSKPEPALSHWQIAILATSLGRLSQSLDLFEPGLSTKRQLHRARTAVTEMINRLTIHEYGPPDETGIRDPVQRSIDEFSDWELQVLDLLNKSLDSVCGCLMKKYPPLETGKELGKLAPFARELAGESESDLHVDIGTITNDMRELAADVALLGPKASSVCLRAGYISWTLAAIYAEVACETKEIAKGHTESQLKQSLTLEESMTKDVVVEAMRVLDGLSNHRPADDCVERLRKLADRLDKCSETTGHQCDQSDADADNPVAPRGG